MKKYSGLKIRIFAIFCLSIIVTTSCSDKSKPPINIAVASNFEAAAKLLLQDFNKAISKPKKINIITNSSGALTSQILNGAPFDLFLSADEELPNRIYQSIKLQKPKIYSYGLLALWVPKATVSSHCQNLDYSTMTVSYANPETAPYGRLAKKILKQINQKPKKTIIASNVLQSYIYVSSNFVDSGFIAYSSLVANNIAEGCIQVFEQYSIPQAAILLDTRARPFYDYIFSARAKKILQLNGYKTEFQQIEPE